MKKWSNDHPRAGIMAEKRAAIVAAARTEFFRLGYSDASMDGIAATAGVSVKTIYNHFRNKSELFSAVIEAACTDDGLFTQARSSAELAIKFAWFDDKSEQGLAGAGTQYLTHLLSTEQIVLYRIVTRDSERFPELGELYAQNVARGRTQILAAYLAEISRQHGWKSFNAKRSASLIEALLRWDLFEKALHGNALADAAAIARHAKKVAGVVWQLFALES